MPHPNIPGAGEVSNYYAEGNFEFDRHTIDGKVDLVLSDNWNLFARYGWLDYSVIQPARFGEQLMGGELPTALGYTGNAGTGDGGSHSLAIGTNYVFSPTFLVDGNFGFARFITDSKSIGYGTNYGLELLGIPGTNGPKIEQSGMPYFDVSGYEDFGITQSFMPYYRSDDQWQYAFNFTWTKGTHEFRWGGDFNRQDMNHIQYEMVGGAGSGARGRFWFGTGPVRLCLTPDGQGGCKSLSPTESRFSFATFLLGIHTQTGKLDVTEAPYTTRNWLTALYVRDRWQVTPKLTASIGTRWEYYPMPTRENRGLEMYDPTNNKILIGGIGQVPTDFGIQMSKTMFAPRLGLAYRVTEDFVIRAGYGLTNDPYPLARPFRTNYPVVIEQVIPAANAWSMAGFVRDGIPPMVTPDLGNGIIDIPPQYTAFLLQAPKFKRGYVQSWNLTLEKELFHGFVGEIGYVATRTIRQLGLREINYADLGTGTAGRKLYQKFGRTADTRLVTPIGHGYYDSLQARLKRRFAGGYSLEANYTWGKAITTSGESNSDGTLDINIPEYYHLLKSVTGFDRPHSFNLLAIVDLPFGFGRKWGSNWNTFTRAILGGWQVNAVMSFYSKTPFTVTASGVNAPGNSNRADQVKPKVEKLGGIGRGQPYFDPTAFADVTGFYFGNSGLRILRGPADFNVDFGLFKNFVLHEEMTLQVRMESFNFTNTPKYNNPVGSVTSRDFMQILGGTGERNFRFGLRLLF